MSGEPYSLVGASSTCDVCFVTALTWSAMEEMTRPEQLQRRMPPQRVKRIGCGPFAETVKIE
jgi:hypothetical protein